MNRPYTSLYIHVPFCQAKCAYCAFYSRQPESLLVDGYLKTLQNHIANSAKDCEELQSIFFGGGTPTLLSVKQWQIIFKSIKKNFTLSMDCEVSIECNPESLTSEKLQLFADLGVNRLSVGIQSFKQKHRTTLGRRGSLQAVDDALLLLEKHWQKRLSFDLIYAIPGQTIADWHDDLQRALEFGIDHISTYSLTFEEGTKLLYANLQPVDDKLQVEMWQESAKIANSAGLQRYEISNLAKVGAECRHNLDIWHGGTYLGLGPAACSFDGKVRTSQPSSLTEWLAGKDATIDKISSKDRAIEILIFGLRTTAGWNLNQFKETTGFDLYKLRTPQIDQLVKSGLLTWRTPQNLALSAEGQLFADTVAIELL